MRCPNCGSRTYVIDARPYGPMFKRRRECRNCRIRFSTFEEIVQDSIVSLDQLPLRIKRIKKPRKRRKRYTLRIKA